MLKIHKETDYALIAMHYFSESKEFVPLSRLIHDTKMPQRFLARITARLTAAGILLSKEGRTGGYKLLKTLDSISLYEFLKIFEGGLHIVSCESPSHECICDTVCKHKEFFGEKLREKIISQFEVLTLADVFSK